MEYCDFSGYNANPCDNKGNNRNIKDSFDSFYINDWTGYPYASKPEGACRILEGNEYKESRNMVNKTNRMIHKDIPDLKGTQIHEMKPVKFGGSPTDIDNKIALTPNEYAKFTDFWNKVLREKMKGR
ncbi:hypothetical protein KQI30_11090 [Clostridium bornimense]|uniref:hypothetical protein n=1 Tax=Clostridium bornimense TaxID=1216932 RepID=UPI001C10E215|nr:hypothetical protein [Clostridium bornimense]MBU5316811.1 hypothetical protein [Clostridium bornimense]